MSYFTLFKFAAVSISTAFASTINLPFAPVPRALVSTDQSTAECSNFKGQWKGVCVSSTESAAGSAETETKQDTVNIQQSSCDDVTLDGQTFHFGGSLAVTETSATNQIFYTVFPEWSANKKAIVAATVSSFKGRIGGHTFFGTGHGSLSFNLVGEQLRTSSSTMSESFFAGTWHKTTLTGNCTYDRVL